MKLVEFTPEIFFFATVLTISVHSISGQSLDCSFEDNWCGWTESDTGPSWNISDDTTVVPEPKNGTEFLLFSVNITDYQVGEIFSPPFDLEAGRDLHLGLWMTPVEDTNAKIEIYVTSTTGDYWTLVYHAWSIAFPESDWLDVLITLAPPGNPPFKIWILGSIDAPDQYIAIDYVYTD